MYLILGKLDGNIECNSVEDNKGGKYSAFHFTDENKEVLKKYTDLWNGIKNETETINGGKKRGIW